MGYPPPIANKMYLYDREFIVMNAEDYFKIQRNDDFVRRLEQAVFDLQVVLIELDKRIEELKTISVNADIKIKPIKVSDLFGK